MIEDTNKNELGNQTGAHENKPSEDAPEILSESKAAKRPDKAVKFPVAVADMLGELPIKERAAAAAIGVNVVRSSVRREIEAVLLAPPDLRSGMFVGANCPLPGESAVSPVPVVIVEAPAPALATVEELEEGGDIHEQFEAFELESEKEKYQRARAELEAEKTAFAATVAATVAKEKSEADGREADLLALKLAGVGKDEIAAIASFFRKPQYGR